MAPMTRAKTTKTKNAANQRKFREKRKKYIEELEKENLELKSRVVSPQLLGYSAGHTIASNLDWDCASERNVTDDIAGQDDQPISLDRDDLYLWDVLNEVNNRPASMTPVPSTPQEVHASPAGLLTEYGNEYQDFVPRDGDKDENLCNKELGPLLEATVPSDLSQDIALASHSDSFDLGQTSPLATSVDPVDWACDTQLLTQCYDQSVLALPAYPQTSDKEPFSSVLDKVVCILETERKVMECKERMLNMSCWQNMNMSSLPWL